jgi:hypothetical protein
MQHIPPVFLQTSPGVLMQFYKGPIGVMTGHHPGVVNTQGTIANLDPACCKDACCNAQILNLQGKMNNRPPSRWRTTALMT